MEMSKILKLSESDYVMILEGLDALKSKDLTGELMVGLFEAILEKKPEDMTEEERLKHERRQLDKANEKSIKEQKKKAFVQEIDLLKAKITLTIESAKTHEPKALLEER